MAKIPQPFLFTIPVNKIGTDGKIIHTGELSISGIGFLIDHPLDNGIDYELNNIMWLEKDKRISSPVLPIFQMLVDFTGYNWEGIKEPVIAHLTKLFGLVEQTTIDKAVVPDLSGMIKNIALSHAASYGAQFLTSKSA